MGVMAHGVGAAYMGQAAGRQLLKPVSAFSSMETARTDLRVELMDQSGKVGPEFQKIIDLSTNLGNKLPGNTADFINMMTMLKSQGMSTQGILGGLGESAAYLAVRMKLPADEAARFVSVLQENTGTSEKDMFGLVDVIQRLRGVGLEADNLLGVYKNLGPVMQTINRQGLDGATALAPFVAMLDQAGMRGDSAGNAIRKVVNASLNMDKVAKANKLMQKNGLALLDFTDGKGEFGGIDQFMAELNKLKNLDTVARGDVIRELFGDDAETGIALGKIIEQGAEGYQDIVRKLQSQADLRKRVEEQLGTLANLWDAATGTFTNTLAVVGEALAPELKALSRWFGDLSEKIGTLAKENPTLTRVLALLAAGISAVLVIGGGLAATVGLLMMTAGAIKMSAAAGLLLKPVVWVLSGLAKGGLLLAKTALPALLVGFKALGAVILANPVGWLLGAIAAIVLAAGLIYKYWAPIKGFFLGFWQGLASAVGPAIVAFGKALAVLLQFFPIRHVFEGIAGVVGWLWRGFKSLFSPVATVGGEFEKATSIGRAFGQMLGNLVMFFPNLISGFVGLGVSLVDGLIGGITTRLGALKEAIVGVGGKAANWFRAKLGINSPSRVFAEFGVNTVQGYQQGLQRKESAPMKQMEGMVKRLKQAGAGLAMAASAHAMPVPTLPNIGIDAPTLPRSIGIDKPQSATLGLPDLPRMGVDLPPLPRLGIDTPALPRSIGIDKPQSAT
ncbi:MAG: phage tail tape measure protein, partial [Porticoccaceae bacterium]